MKKNFINFDRTGAREKGKAREKERERKKRRKSEAEISGGLVIGVGVDSEGYAHSHRLSLTNGKFDAQLLIIFVYNNLFFYYL